MALDWIQTRRSIRKYTAEPVSEADVTELLAAAMAAPSAGNQQPWHFIVIRERSVLNAIPGFHPHASMALQAPVGILVCGDQSLEKHAGYWVQDCAAATENLLLAANVKGLGAVWCGVYPRTERVEGFTRLLQIPARVTPFAFVPVGHPGESKPPGRRYNPERVHHERW
ncbi:MAG: nitroreductase family protein [Candidatus Methylomirabilia bacterium]